MCCRGTEVCVDSWCYPASFVSSALAVAPTPVPKKEISSLIEDIQNSEGLTSFLSEYRSIFVDGPQPSAFKPSLNPDPRLSTDIFASPTTTANLPGTTSTEETTKAKETTKETETPKSSASSTETETETESTSVAPSSTESVEESPSATSDEAAEESESGSAGASSYVVHGGALVVGVVGAMFAAF